MVLGLAADGHLSLFPKNLDMRRLGPLNAERWYQVAGNNLPRTQEVLWGPREECLAPRAGQGVAQQ